jgi:hypothetical protein
MSQRQSGGDNSTNYQVAGNLHVGLSYSDAKAIAEEVFCKNYLQLATEAASIAEERAREISEKFLSRLYREAPEALANARSPDFQRALFRVQEEFATTGDADLGDLLVDILVDRSQQSGNSLRQVVLNEALKTAPRLTGAQVHTLSAIFLARNVNIGANSIPALHSAIRKFWLPIVKGLPRPSDANMGHIAYAGCGSIEMTQVSFADLFTERYPGLLTLGFSEEEQPWVRPLMDKGVIVPCLRDPAKLQVEAVSSTELERRLQLCPLGEHADKVRHLFKTNLMPAEEIIAEISAIDAEIARFYESWSTSPMRNCTLTSVGIAIAHANMKRILGSDVPSVDLWIS